MKYFLILTTSLIFASASNASFLMDKQTPVCIEDFYQNGNSIYFLQSSNNTWYSTTENYTVERIFSGYKYNPDNGNCEPEAFLLLGMDVKDFNFLLGLIGLIFGAVFMFFTTQIFMNVGGKR